MYLLVNHFLDLIKNDILFVHIFAIRFEKIYFLSMQCRQCDNVVFRSLSLILQIVKIESWFDFAEIC